METFEELVDHWKSKGYPTHKIRHLLVNLGVGFVRVAELTVPPRSVEERVRRLREAGVSLRTIAGIPGMPPKSTLHLMVNPENRRNHNQRFTTYLRQEKMKDEQLGLLLEALKALTDAVRSVAVKIDAASK